MAEEYLGRDIRLVSGDLVPHPAGDVDTVTGLDCLRQDLAIRLTTPVGSLRFDRTFGTRVHRYIRSPNTDMTRKALEQDLRLDSEADPRVEPGSATARVVEWDRNVIRVEISVRPLGTPSRLSLVIGYLGDGQVEVQ